MLNFLFLIGGIALIIFSANWLVDGASAIARRFGISELVIGLTIVGFGTSAPELAVNIFSALNGSTDIAIGNILGSNIGNILLILGISAIVFPIAIEENTKWKEIPFSLLAVIVLGVMANDMLFDKSATGSYISRTEGIILLCFMAIFMVYTFEIAKHSITNNQTDELSKQTHMPALKSTVLIVLGLTGLFVGGKYTVDGAIALAKLIGMSEKVIGLTIIAVGTSLPELATSLVAALKKKTDIAIGNVVGSNIFNVFFILGITAIIKPLPFNPSINIDILMASLASILLFVSSFSMGSKNINRTEGVIFVGIYVTYITWLIAFN